ncbi:MAG: transposase [Candidatus Micrarchaeota archaeon]|nr:transposase [Candidatus Micrarchaeota archaeon]
MLSYKFPIYPNKEHKARLESALEMCRFTYNKLLEELQKQDKIDRRKIQHKILELKEQNPDLDKVYSKTLQYECYRLFSNLSALNGLRRKGRKVGHLRFKGRDWFKSMTYNQSGFEFEKKTDKRGIIHLSKIGSIKIKTRRQVSGNVKQAVLKKSDEKWYIILQTDSERKDLSHGKESIGIDLGIENYITDSNGTRVENPKTLGKHMQELRELQQVLSRKKKGSRNREKTRKRLARIHEKIVNVRNDFIHKTTTELVRKCRFIAVEKLDVKEMMEQEYYNARNISDASWGRFLQTLRYKAASAGCEVAEVDPRNTSKICSNCGNMMDMPLHIRTYLCSKCNINIDRDHNAAINILKKASGGLVRASAEIINGLSVKQEASGVSPR